jgi:hypothetical protein
MKIIKKIAFLALLLAFTGSLKAQFNGYNFSVSASYVYTTTSKLYLDPKASDEFLRGIHSYLDKIPGFGIELRAKIADYFFIGLSADYLKKTDKITSVTIVSGYAQNVMVNDGFQVIPVEFTGYYIFPFSLKNYKFFMGGGGGFYFGSHVRTVGDISARTESREISFGIHVVAGVEALLTDYLSIKGAVKFRDMEFSMTNKYDKNSGAIDGMPFQILNTSFDSKAVVDGLAFNIGLSFHF